MKKLHLKIIFEKFAILFSYVFIVDGKNSFKNAKAIFYSKWISTSFKSCGINFLVREVTNLKGLKYFQIGNDFNALDGLRIECWDHYLGRDFLPVLIIGDNVTLNYNVHIGCINRISIGDNVLIGSNVFITDHSHGNVSAEESNISPKFRNLYSKGSVSIEDDVWIGENVSILPNVVIGKGSIVGANSVVTKSFSPYSVIGGVPAKLIKIL